MVLRRRVETNCPEIDLFGARDQLPRFTEYAQTLEFGDAGIGIPRGGMVEACDEVGRRSS